MPNDDSKNRQRRRYSARAVDELLETGGGILAELTDSVVNEVDEALVERWIGSKVGAFRVVELVAGGGMAQVFRAERDDNQFEQVVAIKVLRTSLPSDLSRQFAEESRLLGRLKHTGVAQILDGGVAHGDHWIAMEFVDGRPIDAYCNEFRLTVEQRLTVFVRVASAVQHAHSQLIVHRDIKPGNVLVDADGQPKLLDFGIATALTGRLPAGSTCTADLLTPHYASPEQVNGEPAGVASDIYQLGLLLYSLLTDQIAQEIQHCGIDPIKKAVLEKRPVAPSDRIGELVGTDPERAKHIADARSTSPQKLQKTLKGDLDAIVAKCIEKEADKRYSSVTALVDDVEAFLECRPVQARAPDVMYRSLCFAKRHRGGVAAGLLTILVVLVSLTVVALSWRSTLSAQSHALAEARRAQQVGEFLGEMLEKSNPWYGGSEVSTTRALLDASRDDIDRLTSQPDVQADLLTKFGAAYRSMGAYRESISAYSDGLALWNSIGDINSIVACMSSLAFTHLQLNDIEIGRRYLRDARTIVDAAPEIRAYTRANLRLVEAIDIGMSGGFDEQLYMLEEVIEELDGDDSLKAARLREAANFRMIPNAVYLSDLGRLEKLINNLDDEFAIRASTSAAAPVILLQHKMQLRWMRGELAKAEDNARQALQHLTELFGQDNARTAFAAVDLATLLMEQDKWGEADEYYEFAQDRLQTIYAAHPTSDQHLMEAFRLGATGQFDAARSAFRTARSVASTALDEVLAELGDASLYVDEHRYQEAIVSFELALPDAVAKAHRHYEPVIKARIANARSLYESGRVDEAESAFETLLDESGGSPPHGLPGEAAMLTGLAHVVFEKGDAIRARGLVDRALARLSGSGDSITPGNFDTLLLRAEILSVTDTIAADIALERLGAAARNVRNSRSIQQQFRLTRLSSLLASRGQTALAEELCDGASDSIRRVLDRSHPLSLAAQQHCAVVDESRIAASL